MLQHCQINPPCGANGDPKRYPDENFIIELKVVLEIKNVQGEMGWCNGEQKPAWIAFDYGAFFLCAKNDDLFDLANTCDWTDKVTNFKDSLYKGYTRKGREDLMTTVYLYDILNTCEHWFLPYEEYRSPMELL